MGVYTSHTKLVQSCLWGSVAVFFMLLFIINIIHGKVGLNDKFFLLCNCLVFSCFARFVALCNIFSGGRSVFVFLEGE